MMNNPTNNSSTAAVSAEQALLRDQAQDWLVRLTSGSATTEDAAAYRRWCAQSEAHAAAMADVSRLWEASRHAGKALASRHAQVRGRSPVRAGRRAFIGGALAAGVSGWLVLRPPGNLWPALPEMTADYRTGTGEQRNLTLAVQVKVALNTQTAIDLADNRSGLEIKAGETQIDAPPGIAFKVRAGGGEVSSAAAARYNVRVDGGQVCVTCLAGTVDVAYRGKRLQAAAAEQIVYGGNDVVRSPAPDVGRLNAWRLGVLEFNDVPLAAMVEEINRYRPGKIIIANAELGRRRVQAQLRLNQLGDVVGLIQASYDAQATTLPAGIVVLS
ncbi:FecR family protein [Herbaspirillum robiniae]|uniref:FecR family protein n=1 Tax=Herbaspirillum robiniae TaxID=2014887 RepID=UPI003D77380D